MKVAFVLVFFGLAFGTLGYGMGKTDGYKDGISSALKTNPPSLELEMTCAGLWIGEQNKKYWRKHGA
jgi:hypothetical protein